MSEPATGVTAQDAVTGWLEAFETAITTPDRDTLSRLFQPESHWRDLVALTWHIRTFNCLLYTSDAADDSVLV